MMQNTVQNILLAPALTIQDLSTQGGFQALRSNLLSNQELCNYFHSHGVSQKTLESVPIGATASGHLIVPLYNCKIQVTGYLDYLTPSGIPTKIDFSAERGVGGIPMLKNIHDMVIIVHDLLEYLLVYQYEWADSVFFIPDVDNPPIDLLHKFKVIYFIKTIDELIRYFNAEHIYTFDIEQPLDVYFSNSKDTKRPFRYNEIKAEMNEGDIITNPSEKGILAWFPGRYFWIGKDKKLYPINMGEYHRFTVLIQNEVITGTANTVELQNSFVPEEVTAKEIYKAISDLFYQKCGFLTAEHIDFITLYIMHQWRNFTDPDAPNLFIYCSALGWQKILCDVLKKLVPNTWYGQSDKGVPGLVPLDARTDTMIYIPYIARRQSAICNIYVDNLYTNDTCKGLELFISPRTGSLNDFKYTAITKEKFYKVRNKLVNFALQDFASEEFQGTGDEVFHDGYLSSIKEVLKILPMTKREKMTKLKAFNGLLCTNSNELQDTWKKRKRLVWAAAYQLDARIKKRFGRMGPGR